MKLSDILTEAITPFKKGDQVKTLDGKHRGKVQEVNKKWQYVIVATHDGEHTFTASFDQVQKDNAKLLSPRDKEIKELLDNGSSPEEVADIMKISVQKVLDVQDA